MVCPLLVKLLVDHSLLCYPGGSKGLEPAGDFVPINCIFCLPLPSFWQEIPEV